MTDRKHCKSRVRARMARTGERYATARAHVVGRATAGDPRTLPGDGRGADALDDAASPGLDPGTTALRRLLAEAGLPLSPELALVVGGGVGLGVFQFHYEAEAFSSFFLAGRHRWDDDRAYLIEGLTRCGLEPGLAETGGARAAARHLVEAMAERPPVVAWVDGAALGTRGLPARFEGGMYHVVLVDAIDETGAVTVEDGSAVPATIGADRFLAARGRIAKDRNRLLWLPGDAPRIGEDALAGAVRAGLAATVTGLRAPRTRAFGLDALLDWRDRLRRDGRDGWSRVFPPGGRLLDALTSIVTGIRTQGTDGTLHRRSFGNGLVAAAALLGAPSLEEVGRRYLAAGEAWAALADAALPDGVPAFDRTRSILEERATLYRAEGHLARPRLVELWSEGDAIRAEVDEAWPLEPDATRDLLAGLADRVDALHGLETAALGSLEAAMADLSTGT